MRLLSKLMARLGWVPARDLADAEARLRAKDHALRSSQARVVQLEDELAEALLEVEQTYRDARLLRITGASGRKLIQRIERA